jgi:DNA-binding MarR family transcriptional regulator
MAKLSMKAFRKGLRELEREVDLALSAQTGCCGVTIAQCHLLLAVEEAGEPSVSEIAAVLELDASTLSRTVDGLVKTGLLARREDPANRRRQLVSLTEAGKEKADGINGLCDRYYGGLLGALPEDKVETIAQALPVFAKAMRDWRKNQESADCCLKPAGRAK